MDAQSQSKTRQIGSTLLAIVLWLVTFGLGLEAIYDLKEIYYLIAVRLGSSIQAAELRALGVVFILGLAFLIFIVGTSEYHRRHVGTRSSWRLFGWSIAVELGIVILYYLL